METTIVYWGYIGLYRGITLGTHVHNHYLRWAQKSAYICIPRDMPGLNDLNGKFALRVGEGLYGGLLGPLLQAPAPY